jgi:hypothetical protein
MVYIQTLRLLAAIVDPSVLNILITVKIYLYPINRECVRKERPTNRHEACHRQHLTFCKLEE